jgi:hypothetical protein
MVEGNDALTQTVRRARLGIPNYVKHMVEAYDVPIVSRGLILGQDPNTMTATVPPVSNISFQTTNEARSFMPIQKRSAFVTRSMNSLRDLSTTNPSIQVIATAP